MANTVRKLVSTKDEWKACRIISEVDPCSLSIEDELRLNEWDEQLGAMYPWGRAPKPCTACENLIHCANCKAGKLCDGTARIGRGSI